MVFFCENLRNDKKVVPLQISELSTVGRGCLLLRPPQVLDPRQAVEVIKLGRYDIVRVLGKGAMGLVYEARDPNLDRRVAIKTIKVENLSPEATIEYEARFRTEARSAARLQHPNIVSVYDSDRHGDVAYLVMEFIQGEDLKHHLDRGQRYSLGQSLAMVRELLSALDYAHRQNIVHRDIKPANLLIEANGRLKLTDFGVARIQDSGEATRTQGSMVGTLKYMSPEQVQGLSVDSRSDLFAVGIVLYQLLTGKRPFDGDTDFAIIQQIVSQPAADPSSFNTLLPPAVDAVVARALAKDRAQRFATAHDFALALQDACDQALDATIVPPANTTTGRAGNTGTGQPRSRAGASFTRSATAMENTGSSVTQELELVYWKDVKDSDDWEDLEGFLIQFPEGVYASLARRRLKKLGGAPLSGSLPTDSEASSAPATLVVARDTPPAAADERQGRAADDGATARGGDATQLEATTLSAATRTMLGSVARVASAEPEPVVLPEPVHAPVAAPEVMPVPVAEVAPAPTPAPEPTPQPVAEPMPELVPAADASQLPGPIVGKAPENPQRAEAVDEERTATGAPPAPPPTVSEPAPATLPRRQPGMAIFGLAAVALLAIAGIAYKLLSGGTPAPEAAAPEVSVQTPAAGAAPSASQATAAATAPTSVVPIALPVAQSPASVPSAAASAPAKRADAATDKAALAAKARAKAAPTPEKPLAAVAPAGSSAATDTPVAPVAPQKAAAPVAAAPVATVSTPTQACEGRVLLGYQACMSEQCAKPAFTNHAVCQERRAQEKARKDDQDSRGK